MLTDAKGGMWMSSALLRLRECSQQFSSTERGVAERILAEPQLVVDLSVHELAQRTFSSPSTIVRMCSHTGYSGYKEFRRAVTFELARREGLPIAVASLRGSEAAAGWLARPARVCLKILGVIPAREFGELDGEKLAQIARERITDDLLRAA